MVDFYGHEYVNADNGDGRWYLISMLDGNTKYTITDFQWDDYECNYNEETDAFEVRVKVTNSGDTADKDVVQIYLQSPYTGYDKANGIEKASVELYGFGKTQILNSDESETIMVTVPREEFAVYDYENAKTYILDAGDYYLTAAANAYDEINNILAVKGYTTANGMDQNGNTELVEIYTNNELDTTTYSVSTAIRVPITNSLMTDT